VARLGVSLCLGTGLQLGLLVTPARALPPRAGGPAGHAAASPVASLRRRAAALAAGIGAGATQVYRDSVALGMAEAEVRRLRRQLATATRAVVRSRSLVAEAARRLREEAVLDYTEAGLPGPLGSAFGTQPAGAEQAQVILSAASARTDQALEAYRLATRTLEGRRTALAAAEATANRVAERYYARRARLQAALDAEAAALARVRGRLARLVAEDHVPEGGAGPASSGSGPGSPGPGLAGGVQGLPLPTGVSGLASTLAQGMPATLAGDLARLRQCESSGNYRADTGNGYYGAYQFDLTTWEGLGYQGLPSEAPPAVQDQAAYRLYQERGWAPWPTCSVMLGL